MNWSCTLRSVCDKDGSPWSLNRNRDSKPHYRKGTCPVADNLFERSLLVAIPSCLTQSDEDDIILAFRKVLSRLPDIDSEKACLTSS